MAWEARPALQGVWRLFLGGRGWLPGKPMISAMYRSTKPEGSPSSMSIFIYSQLSVSLRGRMKFNVVLKHKFGRQSNLTQRCLQNSLYVSGDER